MMMDVAIMDGEPADIGHTPSHHGRNDGHEAATATSSTQTGAKGTANHGTEHAPGHQLFVRVETGRTITVCVRSSDVRVHDIQVQIHSKVRAPAHWHRLVFAGKQLARAGYTLATMASGRDPL